MRIVLIFALLLVTAVAVSWLAKIDIVAPTRGEVVARQRTREVQALETGVVAALHADEGVRVRKGILLVELDDTIAVSEVRRIEVGLREARRTARRLRLLAAGPAAGRTGEEGVVGAGNGDGDGDGARRKGRPIDAAGRTPDRGWTRHVRLADVERRRLAAAVAEADRRVEAGRLRLSVIEAERRQVDRLLPVVRERVDGLARLSARSHASRHDYLHELSRRIEIEGRAESLAIEARREEEEIARRLASGRLLRLEYETARQRDLVDVELRIADLHEDLVQARRRLVRHRITAPVDGEVQDIGELAEGSFVQRGARLMAVVPAGGGLEIRAWVRNRDVGFVEAGQTAIVKIDAFPFTRYGTTEGVVEGVSLDAVGGGGPGAPEGTPDEFTAGYLVRIALTRPALEIDGTVVPLRPGMQAAVDIRTGRRRMLEYVVAPSSRTGATPSGSADPRAGGWGGAVDATVRPPGGLSPSRHGRAARRLASVRPTFTMRAMAGPRSAPEIAFGGLVALAVGIGIGRFVYTPILPFMAADLDLTPANGGLVASANFLGHLLGALAAVWARMPGERRTWLLGALSLSVVTTAGMGLTTAMPAFIVLRFSGGVASALAIVLSTALVLDRLAAAGRSGLSWMPFAGVGAGIAVSAVLVSALASHGADWPKLWLASGALSLVGLGACAWLVSDAPGAADRSPPRREDAVRRGLPALVIAYGLFGFGYVITATFIAQLVRTTPEVVDLESIVWLVVGLAAFPSVAFWVWLDRRYGNCTAFAVACLAEGLGIGASFFETSAVAVLIAAAALGGTFMGITALGLIIARRMGAGDPRRMAALMTASFGVGQMIGPTFAGYAYRIGDSFQAPTVAAAAALLVAAALTARLRA